MNREHVRNLRDATFQTLIENMPHEKEGKVITPVGPQFFSALMQLHACCCMQLESMVKDDVITPDPEHVQMAINVLGEVTPESDNAVGLVMCALDHLTVAMEKGGAS